MDLMLSAVTLGDPHLGRVFTSGVPLNRRGEREESMWKDFEESLRNPQSPLHICMGDLFDKAFVPYETVVRAITLYEEAALANPDTLYVVLQGNHDASRDLDKISAFDMFALIAEKTVNIKVVREPWVHEETGYEFYPWDPFKTATELVNQIHPGGGTVFGHWDTESFGGDDHNLIPTALLASRGTTVAFTGHIHNPHTFERDGVTVNVLGSMQPLAHGEGDHMYVTKTLNEVKLDPDAYRDKCLRIDLAPGETMDVEIDCLQLVVRKADEVTVDDPVELGTFDMPALFQKAFDAEGVRSDIATLVTERYTECRT